MSNLENSSTVALPEGWTMRRLKHVACAPLQYGANASAEHDNPDWPRFIRITDIKPDGSLKTDTFRSLPPEQAEGYELVEDDILLARSGSVGRSFIYSPAWGDACFAGYLIRLRISESYAAKFVWWFLQSHWYWFEINSNLIQATIQNFNAEKYNAIEVPSPPISDQVRIANFLDGRTAQIDELIAKKERLLELLAEKRQALITRAVTKGLAANVSMKSSGIDWIGDIPAHWDIKPIKKIGKLIGGSGFPHDYQGYDDLKYPFFKVRHLGLAMEGEYLAASENTVDEKMASELGCSIVQKNNIVFARIGAALLLNRFRQVGQPSCIDNNMMSFRPNPELCPRFMLRTMSRIDFRVIVNPGAIPSLSTAQIGEIQFAIPPKNEQQSISDKLDKQTAQIDECTSAVRRSINLLWEYRAALITTAVTGQVENSQ